MLVLLFITGFSTIVKAQGRGEDKIEALKIAFLTEKLQLTSAEAKQFWPVYNSYEAEVSGLRKEGKNGDVIENEEKLLDIRKKYKPSFEKILGADKTNRLFQAEKEFRAILIKRLKNQRND